MELWQTVSVGAIFLVAALLVVLYRRQLLNRAAGEWAAGQEHHPRIGNRSDPNPHSDGGGSGAAGVSAGGF